MLNKMKADNDVETRHPTVTYPLWHTFITVTKREDSDVKLWAWLAAAEAADNDVVDVVGEDCEEDDADLGSPVHHVGDGHFGHLLGGPTPLTRPLQSPLGRPARTEHQSPCQERVFEQGRFGAKQGGNLVVVKDGVTLNGVTG